MQRISAMPRNRLGKPAVWRFAGKIESTKPHLLDLMRQLGKDGRLSARPRRYHVQQQLGAPLSQYRRIEQTDDKAHRSELDAHQDERPLSERVELTMLTPVSEGKCVGASRSWTPGPFVAEWDRKRGRTSQGRTHY
jgi:hypothetical protein